MFVGIFFFWVGGFSWREWGGFEDFYLILELCFAWGVVVFGCALRYLSVGRNGVRGGVFGSVFLSDGGCCFERVVLGWEGNSEFFGIRGR